MAIWDEMIDAFPGETDTHTFTLPFMAENVARAVVTYRQQGVVRLEKTVDAFQEDPTAPGKCLAVVELSQNDTLALIDGVMVKIQVNVLLTDGQRRSSMPISYSLGDQYHRAVIEVSDSSGDDSGGDNTGGDTGDNTGGDTGGDTPGGPEPNTDIDNDGIPDIYVEP